jgi:hypothetical protein
VAVGARDEEQSERSIAILFAMFTAASGERASDWIARRTS